MLYFNWSNMEKLDQFTLTFYFSSLFILGIIFILILVTLNAKKRTLLDVQRKELEFETILNKVQLKSIEDERRKLGSILHDDLGQLLTLIHMQLSELKKNDRDNSSLKMIEDLCNSASERCSSISKMLFPATLIRLGFIEGLQELISDIQHATRIHIEFKHDDFELSDDKSSNLFRIFQELLNNTLKHAKATKVNIHIHNTELGICVNYSDNGIGLNKKSNVEGLGTTTINTRLHILGGEIVTSNQKKKGYTISFIMPYGKD